VGIRIVLLLAADNTLSNINTLLISAQMNYILKSRFYQICFVSVSLLFVLWLSASMWIDAFAHRQDARRIQFSSVQEETLFDLADAVSVERQLFYKLFSSSEANPSGVTELRKISENNHALASGNISALSASDMSVGASFRTIKRI